MRLVFLQSAIQNPKSRIQNHVSALRRSSLGHGHGQAIGAPMHGSAPWKTEETIVGLPRLLVLSAFSRSDSPDLVAVTFHRLSPFIIHLPDLVAVTFHLLSPFTSVYRFVNTVLNAWLVRWNNTKWRKFLIY